MENKIKEAIKLLDGYSYILAVGDSEETVASAKGSMSKITELLGRVMATTIEDATDKSYSLDKATETVLKESMRVCLDTVMIKMLSKTLEDDNTLDTDLIKALKEELTC